jgi:hypothetical protein
VSQVHYRRRKPDVFHRDLADACAHDGCTRDSEDPWGYCEIHWAERTPHLTRANVIGGKSGDEGETS